MSAGDDEVTVIGAGPVGSLLALMLARRGHQVNVFERRPDMRKQQVSAGRSINLAVSTRGLHALGQVGLAEEVLRQAVPMFGRMMHSPAGELSFLRYGRDESEFINSMSRGELNKLLVTRAEETGRVRFHFQHRLLSYDFATRQAELRDEASSQTRRAAAEVLIGSDGSASVLRTSMASSAGDVSITSDVLDAGYKELTMPPAAGGGFALEKNALHIWPRGRFMLIALPNLDGSFTCTLFLPFEANQPAPCFARLVESTQVSPFFAEHFADAVPRIPGLEEQFLAAPLGQMVTVKASRWSLGPTLLLGDAAHAIVPFFGQGMNAGFEDCALLDQLLGDQSTPDWAELFARFSQARKVDTDAIADLAVENFVEMRDKVADPEFLLWKAVEAEINKRYPGRYLSRYQLVTFSRLPYHLALEAGKRQARMLRALTAGKSRAEDVDYSLVGQFIADELDPLTREL